MLNDALPVREQRSNMSQRGNARLVDMLTVDLDTRDFGIKLVHALQAVLAVRSCGSQPSDEFPVYGLTDALSHELRRTLGELRRCKSYQEPEKVRGSTRTHISVLREAGEQLYAAAIGELGMIPPATLKRFLRSGSPIVERITGRRFESQGSVDGASSQPPATSNVPDSPPQAGLRPAQRKAYASYGYAEKHMPSPPKTDRDAYRWLKDNMADDDYELPTFETWARQVRAGRKQCGDRKHAPRAGRSGRSIVPMDQVDLSHHDKE